jgi:hypothetical protein
LVLFAPDPLLLPITTLAFVQISQRSTLRLEMGMTLLSPLALSTRSARAIAKATARAVRKESKTASKTLLTKTGKTLRARLSHIRHKNQQKSRLSIPILRDLRLNLVLFAPDPLLLPITTLAFVQISQRSTLRLEMGITPETARATARAVRKESKTASKTLLTKTGKTLRARSGFKSRGFKS